MLQPQQVFCDRYRLEQLLGRHAGRETWRATDLLTGEAVVVKFLTFSDQVDWDQLRLFEREAQVLKQLNHPCIPRYRDFFCLDERLLWFGLVQQYIPGRSLKQILADGIAWQETEARNLAMNVLQILIYLHGLIPPILHRDIKPSNLLCGENGRLYLIDFGAVQDRAAREGATFTVVGTYGYVPLEQLGGRATPASDLYALGATLIHLLTGIAPADLPQTQGRLEFAHLVSLNPGFVRWLETLVEPNLADRFKSARLALDALKQNAAALAEIGPARPPDSRIFLEKSPTHLKVTMPSGRFQSGDLLILLGLGLGFVVVLSLPLWYRLGGLLVLLVLTTWWFLPAFRKTVIALDSQTLVVSWTVLGFLGRRWAAPIRQLDRVTQGELRGAWDKVFPGVSFTVGVREYVATAFAPPLTTQECDWLVGEIRQWLGLVITPAPNAVIDSQQQEG